MNYSEKIQDVSKTEYQRLLANIIDFNQLLYWLFIF